jgi:hypothetical protein
VATAHIDKQISPIYKIIIKERKEINWSNIFEMRANIFFEGMGTP